MSKVPGGTIMSKYYIKSGTLELIYSCNKCPRDAAMDAIWEINENDTLEGLIYLDERGYRDYKNADGLTCVLHTSHILKDAGWSIE
jgi:hypothetical protein